MNKDEIVKQEILDAAKVIFQKWGLNKSTMEDIAQEAGKGKSTLYYYFKSKDDIIETLALEEMDIISSKAKFSIDRISSSKEKLKKYFVTMLEEIKKAISIYPLMTGEIKGNKVLNEKIRNQLGTIEETILIDILKSGVATGEFSFRDELEIKKAASVTSNIIHVVIFYLFFENEDIENIEIATRLISEGF